MSELTIKWPPQLVLDIAMEAHNMEELCEKYSLFPEQIEQFYSYPSFRKELATMKSELTGDGSIFRAKARSLAEIHLDTVNELLSSPDVAAQTKIAAWQALVKFANLEPKKDAETTALPSGGINIQINM